MYKRTNEYTGTVISIKALLAIAHHCPVMLSSHFYTHMHIHSHITYSLGYIVRKQCLYKDLTHEKEREVISLQGTAHFLYGNYDRSHSKR